MFEMVFMFTNMLRKTSCPKVSQHFLCTRRQAVEDGAFQIGAQLGKLGWPGEPKLHR